MSIGKRALMMGLAFTGLVSMAGQESKKIEPLDYSKEENWVELRKDGDKPVDVFFIYPTVADTSKNEDGFLSISEMKDIVGVIQQYQVSVYEDAGNIYMPFYRQASMTVADACKKDNAAYLDALYKGKAYADIAAALDCYFEKYNKGKPFILASHSQGAAMVVNVLTHYMQEHKEYLSRMIAAYAIGYAPSEEIFNETTGLKFATREDDVNVVISFTTEGPTAEGKSILLPEKPMVINPLNWKTDDTYAPAELNKGYLSVTPTMDCFTLLPGCDDAQINLKRKTVVCTTRSAEEFSVAPEDFATESFHEREYGMYFENLKENVKVRIAAYFAGKSQATETAEQPDDSVIRIAISEETKKHAEETAELNASNKMLFTEGVFEKVLPKFYDRTEEVFPECTVENKLECFECAGSKVYTLSKENYENVVLYIHGGAWIGGISTEHITFCDAMVEKLNAKVYMPLYPLAPQATAKETYAMVEAFYKELLKEGKKLYLMGDSAGGNIALGLLYTIKAEGLAYPDKTVLLSPCVDMSFSNEALPEFEKIDPILPVYGCRKCAEIWAGAENLKDPKNSALYADVAGYPDMMFIQGTDEIIYPDMMLFYEKLKKAGVNAKLVLGEGLWHVFPVDEIPEKYTALDLIQKYCIG